MKRQPPPKDVKGLVSATTARRVVVLLIPALLLQACGSGSRDPGPAREVRFEAAAARTGVSTIVLEGAVWGTGRNAVVFAHAFGSSQDAWAPFAREIAGRGFMAVTFNFRGYGLSQGVRAPALADLDLEGALAHAKKLGADHVHVVGAGMGAIAALVVASKTELRSVVALSSPVAFRGLAAGPAPWPLRAPVLIVAARDDPQRAAGAAQTLEERISGAARLVLVDGTEHGSDLLDGQARDRIRRLVTEFLLDRKSGR